MAVCLPIELNADANTPVRQRVSHYFPGKPPAATDLLSWYFQTPALATVVGAKIQIFGPALTNDAVFHVRNALAGDGDGFTLTLPAGDFEAVTANESLAPSSNYAYLRCVTPSGIGDFNLMLLIDQAASGGTRRQRISQYFPGKPVLGDMLSWYFEDSEVITVKGLHLRAFQSPSADASFQVRTALAGGGSGFNFTLPGSAVEAVATGESLSLTSSYIYLRCLDAKGAADIQATLLVNQT